MTAIRLIHDLGRRWRRRRLVQHCVESAGVALMLAGGLGGTLGWSLSARSVVALLLAGIVLGWRRRREPGRHEVAQLVARHLNRQLLEVEDSCELLLEDADRLSGMAQVQRQRTARRLMGRRDAAQVPGRPLVHAAAAGLLSFVVTAGLIAIGPVSAPAVPHGAATRLDRPPARTEEAPVALAPIGLRVEIVPPAYTGVPPHTTTSLDVSAEEGAHVQWTVSFASDSLEVLLMFGAGDSVSLKANGVHYTARRRVRQPDVYTLIARDRDSRVHRSRFHRLDMIADRAPGITVTAPTERRSRATEGEQVGVRVSITDDYGVADAELIATLARGTGENVRFRELHFPFETPLARGQKVAELRTTLDLAALALEPGDELYFYVAARDNREPQANAARSETYFLNVPDTGRVRVVSLEGVAVSLLPEYFRSQRQIIIDTEHLIAERGRLARGEFGRRSNNIGIDQKALRLRYGRFIGEESNSGIVGGDFTGEDDEHAGETRQPAEGVAAAVTEALEPFTHTHDTEDIATFFSEAVREQLKAVLGQMWEAELRLRTARPETALPYEYRALELLKELQEAARLYVLRVGFESPPLRPDETRLTGNLDEVESRSSAWTAAPDVTFPEVRDALDWLDSFERREAGSAFDVAVLEAAGRALARAALIDPLRSVAALDALRTLIDQVGTGSVRCATCADVVRRGLWALLPPAPPAAASHATYRSGLTARYVELLQESRR